MSLIERERFDDPYRIECDGKKCGEYYEESTFEDLIDNAKADGWVMRKLDDDREKWWHHWCPDCWEKRSDSLIDKIRTGQ